MIQTNEIYTTPTMYFRYSLRFSIKKKLILLPCYFLLLNIINVFMFGLQDYLRAFWVVALPINLLTCGVILLFHLLSMLVASYLKPYKMYQRPYHYEIDEKFIKIIREGGPNGSFTWDGILRVIKTKKYYLLPVTTRNMMIVPLDAFKTPSDLEHFNRMLHDKNL